MHTTYIQTTLTSKLIALHSHIPHIGSSNSSILALCKLVIACAGYEHKVGEYQGAKVYMRAVLVAGRSGVAT